MSPDRSPEQAEKQIEIKDFIFPNEYPHDLVREEMGLLLAYVFVNPEFNFDPDYNMGTIWPTEVRYLSRKTRMKIDEMNLEELQLEFLLKQRLPEEF